jgi:hypothetical protein
MNPQPHPVRQNHSVDPITLEVIRHGIVSITDQIDANISRTAFSPYIYEYKDFAVGLVGADGELIAQCTGGMPVFSPIPSVWRYATASPSTDASDCTMATSFCAITLLFRASI